LKRSARNNNLFFVKITIFEFRFVLAKQTFEFRKVIEKKLLNKKKIKHHILPLPKNNNTTK